MCELPFGNTPRLAPDQVEKVLCFRGWNISFNLVLRSARHPEARVPHLGRAPRRIARVSKDGHKRDRAGGHPSRRSARKAARRAPQDEAFETAQSDWIHGIALLVAGDRHQGCSAARSFSPGLSV